MDDAHTRRWMRGVIGAHRDAIEARLGERVASLRDSAYHGRPAADVAGWIHAGVGVLLASLDEGGAPAALAHASRLSHERRALGFPIRDVVSASLLMLETVAPLLADAPRPDDVDAQEAIALVGARMRDFVAAFTEDYAAAMQRSVEAERHRTVSLLEAVEAAGASLDLDVVLQRVAAGIATALDVPWCGIFFPGEDDRLFAPRGMAGELGPDHLARLVGRVFERREEDVIGEPLLARSPVVFRSEDDSCLLCGEACSGGGIGAAVGFPILRGDRELAVALAACHDPARAFDAEQIQLAWGLSNVVAPAVDNARLHDETRRQLAESRALQRIMRAIIGSHDLTGVLAVVCDEARALLDAWGAAIYLVDDAEREPTLVTCRGPGCDHRASLSALADSLVAAPAADDGLLRRDGLSLASATGDGPVIRRVVAAPLRDEDERVGVLLVIEPPSGIGPASARLVHLLADHATVAVRDERLRRQRERIAILEERERLAHDLHDSVSQSLYGVTMYAEAAARLMGGDQDERVEDHLRELRGTALDALRQMRLVIFELRPPDLRERGLVAALQARLMAVEARSGVAADFDADLPGRLPLRVEDALLGIAQEALNNALRHARADAIHVRIGLADGGVRLEVRDDGVGFDPAAARTRGGLGLPGMEERASKIQGTLTIASRPGGGTTVRAVVPRPERFAPEPREAEAPAGVRGGATGGESAP